MSEHRTQAERTAEAAEDAQPGSQRHADAERASKALADAVKVRSSG